MWRCAAVLALGLGACSSDLTESPGTSQPRTRGLPKPAAAPQATPQTARRPSSDRERIHTGLALDEAATGAVDKSRAAAVATPPAAAAAEEKKRDYGKELVDLMAGATGCLKPRDDKSAPEVRVSLNAKVMPSGRISRGSVGGGGLGPEETACLKDRLEHGYLSGPIEDAPRSVSGTLVLKLGPAPAKP